MAPTLATTKELLARLVAFDTTSAKSNLDIIAFIETYLAGHGIASTRVPNAASDKASLFATIGSADTPGVAISGHTDVVPVAGQSWDTNPFELVAREGRLYGRGTTDMKGYLASALAFVPEWKRRRLAMPIHLVFSYDEEVGCTGVRPMIAELGRTLVKPRIVLVGEPTSMTVVDAHKGPVRWGVDIKGRPAHSSMAHLGANAIMAAGKLITELGRLEEELKTAQRIERFTPAYTTLQVNRIEGGAANNIVAEHCKFGWEIRALPGFDVAGLERRVVAFAERECLPRLKAVAPESEIVIRQTNSVPAFAARRGSDALSLALKLTGQNETFAVSYATEASLFELADAPAIVCGPGNISEAHTANEFIHESELEKCLVFFGRLADWAELA